MQRGFCIPEHKVPTSPKYERLLLLLVRALMDARGIETQVSADPELGVIEGFVLADGLIVANWLRGPGVWYVDTDAPAVRWRTYQDISNHSGTKSIIASPTAAGRLQAMAGYLDISWTWFSSRCCELAEAGIEGLVHSARGRRSEGRRRSRSERSAGPDRSRHGGRRNPLVSRCQPRQPERRTLGRAPLLLGDVRRCSGKEGEHRRRRDRRLDRPRRSQRQ